MWESPPFLVVRNAPLVRASREHHPRSIGVKIAVSVWLGYAPLYLAKEEGFFHKRGLDVHVVVINSPVDRRAAFAADRIQGFATTVDTLVMTAAAETRIPVRQVLVLDVSHGADGLVAKKEIKTI